MKKNIFLFAVVLLTAFVGVSCSNEDILSEVPTPNPSKEVAENIVTFTATLDAKGGSGMRAVSASGATTWVENEEILISYENTSSASVSAKATVESVDANGKATITAPLVNPKDGCEVNFYYPYESWKSTSTIDFASGQDGTLSRLSQYFDRAMDNSYETLVPYTLSVSGGVATLPSSINMLNQVLIWKLSFTDGTTPITSAITKLEIHVSAGGTTDYTITPTAPITDYFYVAMGGITNKDIVFTAHTSSGIYRRAKSGINLDEGKIYTTQNLALNKVELGKLFGADGNVYADAAEVAAASTTAIGVVAYIGTDNFTENGTTVGGSAFVGHGLVMCLKNAASDVAWCDASYSDLDGLEFGSAAMVTNVDGLKRTTNVSGYSNTKQIIEHPVKSSASYPAASSAWNYTTLPAPTTGTTGWFLPTAQQWVKMQSGLGELNEDNLTTGSWYDNNHPAANKWEDALSKAGSGNYDSMKSGSLYFWSSSESDGRHAWYLGVAANRTGSYSGFKWTEEHKNNSGENKRVRPVLAF